MKKLDLDLLTFEEFKAVLEKSKNQSYSSGCLMGYFNKGFKDPKIKEDDLYNNEENEYGLEIEPHVTVLYGLHDDEIDENEIIKLFTLIDGPVVTTNKITLFKNEKFDVVKWDIDSEELVILNKMVEKMFPFTSSFPDYHAHCTIAYCLPGKGDEYTKEYKSNLKNKIDYWVYSKANGKKIKIVPGKGAEIIRKEKAVNERFITEEELAAYGNNSDVPRHAMGLVLDPEPEPCLLNPIKIEEINYKGYIITLTPNERFKESFNCTVHNENNEYVMGIRGPANYDDAIESAKSFIDNEINKEN